MNPLDAVSSFFVGLIHEGHLQAWMRLLASMAITIFVAFFGTLGLSIVATHQMGLPTSAALVLGIAHASIAMATAAINMWVKSPLTKGIPILYSGAIEAQRITELTKDGTVFNPNEKR